MANIEISTLTRNNDGNTYIIKDANAIPKTGSNQISGDLIPTTDNSIDIGSSTNNIKMLFTKAITIDDKTIDTDANGNMTFDSHKVDTIEEQGDGYIRYTNGIQICWGSVSWQSSYSTSWGALYESTSASGVYARSFIQTPYVSACNISNDKTYAIIESAGGSNTSTPNFYLCRGVHTNVIQDCNVSYIAIGRWK